MKQIIISFVLLAIFSNSHAQFDKLKTHSEVSPNVQRVYKMDTAMFHLLCLKANHTITADQMNDRMSPIVAKYNKLKGKLTEEEKTLCHNHKQSMMDQYQNGVTF